MANNKRPSYLKRQKEQARKTRAQKDLVFGDHDAHGSSTVNLVPMP